MPDANLPLPLLLFLSHAGVDTEAARRLKQRLEAAPEAREHGLRVWFDKDDLRAGELWQAQLEKVIRHSSTAFAVYVGSRGVVNWVDAEIQLALGRAVTDPAYRLIPILAPQAPGPEALPGFVALYQGVADVEGRPNQFAKLVAATLGWDAAGTAKLEAEPFFGLKAVDEDRAHLFFGREPEAETLLRLLHREPLVMVTGDSGSGKSSLARAGLIPHWRGGALAEAMGERPSDTVWHVVQTQPRSHPLQALAEAVGESAKRLGLSLADRGTLESWARSGDPDQVRRALWCDLPPDRTRVLLLVDQFEELVTITEPIEREPFIQLILALADPNDSRAGVVRTMRRDYYNLVSAFPELYDRLEAKGHHARLILGRISPDGLRRLVTEPLRLAGVPEGDRTALAAQVVAEMGDRPGDLALVQMALTETWNRRKDFDNNLLRAYAGVGRIEGAIARAAEGVYQHVLDEDERALTESVFIRLVRLGDTGGATRRLATRIEFDDAKWRLVQKLASKQAKRLVLVGTGDETGETTEIAHEALVTQWPRYQTWLSGRDPDGADRAADKRTLDALTPRAASWAAAPDARAKVKRLATGADLEAFVGLATRRPTWLPADEHNLVLDSRDSAARQRRRERRLFQGAIVAAVLAIGAAAGAWQQWNWAVAETRRAEAQRALAEEQKAEAERQTTLADQRAKELTAALAEARANLIWGRLEFTTLELQPHELSAIWELATGGAAKRAAFLKQLTENRSLVLRLAQRPDPVIRALGLRLTTEQTQTLLDAVLGAIKGITHVDVLAQLLSLTQVLRAQLSPEQAALLLGRVADAIAVMDNGFLEAPRLLKHVKALGSSVAAEKAQAAADIIFEGMLSPGIPEALLLQAHVLQVLPVQLTTEQAQAVLDRVLNAFKNPETSTYALLPLTQTVETLPVQLTDEQVQSVLRRVLDTINNTATPLFALKDLAQAVQAIASKLTAEQARTALREQAQAALGARLINTMRGSTDPEALKAAAGLIKSLPLRLTDAQMQAGLSRVLDVIRDNSDPNALQPLFEAVELIPVQLTDEQAQAALGRVLDTTSANTSGDVVHPVKAVQALASKLTARQTQAALGTVLETMHGTEPTALQVLAELLSNLAPKLSMDQAQASLNHTLNTMPGTSNADALEALAVTVGNLASRLATDRHQAQAALGPILDGIRAASEPRALLPLLQSVQKLVPQLTTDQAQAALVPVFDHMRDVLRISPNVLQALAPTISMLPVQLTAEQMQLAFAGVLDNLLLVGPVNQEQRVGKAIEMLAPRLTADQAQTALRAILHAMFSRGLLGVELQGVSKNTARRLTLPEPRGAFVRRVTDGSPAATAGILADDVILAFDGKAIDTAPMLARLIASERPGKEGVVTLWRRGEKKNLTVTLGENTSGSAIIWAGIFRLLRWQNWRMRSRRSRCS